MKPFSEKELKKLKEYSAATRTLVDTIKKFGEDRNTTDLKRYLPTCVMDEWAPIVAKHMAWEAMTDVIIESGQGD